jgi:putative hydroxymethylpyrimidine transport system permease protein
MSTADRLPPVAALPHLRPVASNARGAALALALPGAGLALWEAWVLAFSPPAWLLPAPSDIGHVLWADRARLWFHAQATIVESLIGLALAVVAGLLLAMAITASRTTERAVYPWVVASQTVPILAVAPLLGVWVGFGTAQVLVAAVFCFFPIVVIGVDTFRATDRQLVDTARSMGASKGWIWRHVTFPAALPALLSGLKLAAVFAVTGAVVAEYIGTDRGLGFLSELSTSQFETVVTFAAVAWLAAIGLAYFAAISLLERLLLPYRYRSVRQQRRWIRR